MDGFNINAEGDSKNNKTYAKAEWIPVEDELPIIEYEDRNVLCICEVVPTPRHRDIGYKIHKDYRIACIPMGSKRFVVRKRPMEDFYKLNVTHWMPLPEPPTNA